MSRFVLLLAAVVGCSASPGPESASPPASQAAHVAPAPVAPAPVNDDEPRVEVSVEGVRVQGVRVAELPSAARLQKVTGLFEDMKERRQAWKAAHADAPHPGSARIVVSEEVMGGSLRSVFQTVVYAGYPNVTLEHAGQEARFAAQLPGPPCGEGDCEAVGSGYTVFVEAGDGFRIKLPSGREPLRRSGKDGLDMALDEVAKERELVALVAFIAPRARAHAFVPQLMQASRFAAQLLQPLATLSARSFDAVPDTAMPVSIRRWRGQEPHVGANPTNITGRLPPAVIQEVVRSQFTALRRCYEEDLKRNPKLEGRTVTRFVIGRDGKVQEAKASGDGFSASALGCIEQVFAALAFPPPEGGIVSVSYPVVFTPGG